MKSTLSQNFARDSFAVFKYVLGAKPSPILISRYQAALIKNGLDNKFSVPSLFRTFPFLIMFLELTGPKSQKQIALCDAIRIACFIAETNPETVGKFCNAEGSRAFSLFKLFWRLALEAILLPVRIIFSMLAKSEKT